MKLKCKIYPKYLDDILNKEKNWEFREIESIIFDDGKRKVEVDVLFVGAVLNTEDVKESYPDVKWGNKPIIRIELGKILKED